MSSYARLPQMCKTEIGEVEIGHPAFNDLPELISLLESEDLDLRRLKPTGQDSYPSLGKKAVYKRWIQTEKQLNPLLESGKIPPEINKTLLRQGQEIISFKQIPDAGNMIHDPFNLDALEKNVGIETLKNQQLENILLLKKDGRIIATVRVLSVEGNWEMVSLLTKPEYRKKGLASLLIEQLLARYSQRPLFSFQQIQLVSFYLRRFDGRKPFIPAFSDLTDAFQRDLFYMNIFWGPHIIIEIPNK